MQMNAGVSKYELPIVKMIMLLLWTGGTPQNNEWENKRIFSVSFFLFLTNSNDNTCDRNKHFRKQYLVYVFGVRYIKRQAFTLANNHYLFYIA